MLDEPIIHFAIMFFHLSVSHNYGLYRWGLCAVNEMGWVQTKHSTTRASLSQQVKGGIMQVNYSTHTAESRP